MKWTFLVVDIIKRFWGKSRLGQNYEIEKSMFSKTFLLQSLGFLGLIFSTVLNNR